MKSKKMLEHKFMAFDLTERKETMMKEENAVSGKDQKQMSVIPAEKEECGNVQTKRLDRQIR